MEEFRWYAVYTASRAEKKVKERLTENQIENYLPLRTEYRIWSDRKKKVSFPLISGYIFVKIESSRILDVLNIQGVLCFLKEKKQPVIIPEKQIKRLKMMVENAFEDVEFTTEKLSKGDKVILRRGGWEGLIGELMEIRGKYKIAIRLQHFGCALTTVPLSWVERID